MKECSQKSYSANN